MNKIFLFLMTLLCIFTSCSEEEMSLEQSSEQTIQKIQSYFYKNRTVRIHQLKNDPSGKSWAVAVKSGNRPCEVFQDITGVRAKTQSKYSYRYVTPDGQCRISIKGTAEPDNKAIYAIMQLSVPQCPEIEEIYITTEDFFNGENTAGQSQKEDVPVIL